MQAVNNGARSLAVWECKSILILVPTHVTNVTNHREDIESPKAEVETDTSIMVYGTRRAILSAFLVHGT